MKFILTSFLFFSSLLGAETRLAILGSGTPNPDPQRMGSSYAVIVNDNAYLVDFGPGVIRRAAELSPNWGGDIDASISPPQFGDSSAALLITPGPKSTKYALSFTITA